MGPQFSQAAAGSASPGAAAAAADTVFAVAFGVGETPAVAQGTWAYYDPAYVHTPAHAPGAARGSKDAADA